VIRMIRSCGGGMMIICLSINYTVVDEVGRGCYERRSWLSALVDS